MSPPRLRRVILLLGPTQVGKSSVANFLLNGTVDVATNKFKVGDGTKSCTGLPQCENFTQEDKVVADFSIIDTAGAGDSGENDTENMMALYKFLLQENIEISCVAFVLRYPTLENQEYKNIVAFYKTMLANAFGKNIIVIVSHAEVKNSKWVRKQERVGKNPTKVIDSMVDSIREMLGLKELTHYALDALASDCDVPEDYNHALECRRRILEKCINSPGFRPDQLAFPKSLNWQRSDAEKAKELEYRCDIITERLKVLNLAISTLTKYSAEYNKIIKSLSTSIATWLAEIGEYDNDKLRIISSNTIKLGWFFWIVADFRYEVEYNIARVTTTQGSLDIRRQEGKVVEGTIAGGFFTDLNATIHVWGHSREVKGNDIHRLRTEVKEKRVELEKTKEQLQSNSTVIACKVHEKQMLEIEQANSRAQIIVLKAPILTLDQVRAYVCKIGVVGNKK